MYTTSIYESRPLVNIFALYLSPSPSHSPPPPPSLFLSRKHHQADIYMQTYTCTLLLKTSTNYLIYHQTLTSGKSSLTHSLPCTTLVQQTKQTSDVQCTVSKEGMPSYSLCSVHTTHAHTHTITDCSTKDKTALRRCIAQYTN